MSAGLISVPEDWSQTELIAAGWRQEDLDWEGAAENALEFFAKGEDEKARSETARAVRIATANFSDDDPRLGCGLANHGAALIAAGLGEKSSRTVADAIAVWRRCDRWVAGMTAPRVARSSLFHLRMEQRHRATYEARWRIKWAELVESARASVPTSGALVLVTPAEAAERLARWRRERPAMLNDTRKLMAAVLLLACRAGDP
jgi:hypothetical protein